MSNNYNEGSRGDINKIIAETGRKRSTSILEALTRLLPSYWLPRIFINLLGKISFLILLEILMNYGLYTFGFIDDGVLTQQKYGLLRFCNEEHGQVCSDVERTGGIWLLLDVPGAVGLFSSGFLVLSALWVFEVLENHGISERLWSLSEMFLLLRLSFARIEILTDITAENDPEVILREIIIQMLLMTFILSDIRQILLHAEEAKDIVLSNRNTKNVLSFSQSAHFIAHFAYISMQMLTLDHPQRMANNILIVGSSAALLPLIIDVWRAFLSILLDLLKSMTGSVAYLKCTYFSRIIWLFTPMGTIITDFNFAGENSASFSDFWNSRLRSFHIWIVYLGARVFILGGPNVFNSTETLYLFLGTVFKIDFLWLFSLFVAACFGWSLLVLGFVAFDAVPSILSFGVPNRFYGFLLTAFSFWYFIPKNNSWMTIGYEAVPYKFVFYAGLLTQFPEILKIFGRNLCDQICNPMSIQVRSLVCTALLVYMNEKVLELMNEESEEIVGGIWSTLSHSRSEIFFKWIINVSIVSYRYSHFLIVAYSVQIFNALTSRNSKLRTILSTALALCDGLLLAAVFCFSYLQLISLAVHSDETVPDVVFLSAMTLMSFLSIRIPKLKWLQNTK